MPICYVLHQRKESSRILHQFVSHCQRIVHNFIGCDSHHLDDFGLELSGHGLIRVCRTIRILHVLKLIGALFKNELMLLRLTLSVTPASPLCHLVLTLFHAFLASNRDQAKWSVLVPFQLSVDQRADQDRISCRERIDSVLNTERLKPFK